MLFGLLAVKVLVTRSRYFFDVPELARTRAYASQLLEQTAEDAATTAVANLRTFGFAVLDNIIPPECVDAVRAEVETVTQQVQQDQRPDRDLQRPGEKQPSRLDTTPVELTFRSARVDRNGRNNPIGLLPQFREYMAHPVLLEVGRQMLDDHLRWCQVNYRSYEGQRDDGSPGGFGPVANRGKLKREWRGSLSIRLLLFIHLFDVLSLVLHRCYMTDCGHACRLTDTDWPHDLNAYGGGNPEHNAGAIRQPFPDITMCLSCVWYLSETGPEAGGELQFVCNCSAVDCACC